MTRLRAHFDGKVLVPTEPVDLPKGKILDVEVHDEREVRRGSAQAILEALRATPPIDLSIVDEWERAIKEGERPATGNGVFDDLA
jgi:hypothetical protein